MIEEFVQEFRKVARISGYERQLLMEKFKRDMNEIIQQKLIKSEYHPKAQSSDMSRQQIWIGTGDRVEGKKRD